MKLALNMIVKASDEEAEVLKQCLTSVAPHVDGIYITITGENERCEQVAKAFNANVSHFEWINDFAAARNFALAQVPKEYDYWMWLDADDVLDGADKLRDTIEENAFVDAFVFNYLYAFDRWGNPVVVHAKERVFRNDGCVEWRGKLHEGFHKRRKLDVRFVDGIRVLHMTDDERIQDSRERNVVVAEGDIEANPDDPRSYWNAGNALKAAGRREEALEAFAKFLEMSESDDEKYIVHLRLSEIHWQEDNLKAALQDARMAIAIHPQTPDAHILAAKLMYAMGKLMEAKEYAMIGLQLQPQYLKYIVYNPRDYDYEPLKLLAQIYLGLSLPQLALEAMKACLEITPLDEGLQNAVKLLEEESDKAQAAVELVNELKELDDEELKERLDGIPSEIASHPSICHLRNIRFIKQESSGKDVVFYCGNTKDEWNPEIARESGIGGSEEAVIHLSRLFAANGYNVTVYNNCGSQRLNFEGVEFRPHWEWNYRDKQDITIIWRSPKPVDYDINSDKIFIDLHDVIEDAEFTEKRLEKITKVFCKSQTHRELFPSIPDDQVVVVQNGIVWEQFQEEIERDPYLLINTSSPDRSLFTLAKAFKRIKAEVPQARLKWAYGWNVWDVVHGGDADKLAWKKEIMDEVESIDGFEALGRIGHTEVAKLYQEGGIFAYPTAFFEIDCISARKAQASGAIPVSTDFAALKETIQYGTKVHVNVEHEEWATPDGFDFSLHEEAAVDEWVNAVIAELKAIKPEEERQEMRDAMKQFDWENIANTWMSEM